MTQAFLALLLALTFLGACPPASGAASLKVLFVGNSYSYFNNLPEMVEKLSATPASPRPLQATMIAVGGATLQSHWQGGNALKAIRRGGWDYVVLQEQSTLGVTYIVNGSLRIVDSPTFRQYARQFDEEIRKAGAKTILMLTWARKGTVEREQSALTYAYSSLGKSLRAEVAPVGVAWQAVRKARPGLELYNEDGSHPSAAGTYLSACVLYATIYGKSPVGLPSRVVGHTVDDDANVAAEGNSVLVDLPAADASLIQSEAWKAHEATRASGGYPKASEPAPPARPVPPQGQRPEPAALEGTWVGSFEFYPVSWPATMELRLMGEGAGLGGSLKITFAGHPDAEKVLELSELRVTDSGIAFVDVKGLNGAPVRYVGSYANGRLEGTAEVRVPNEPIYAIGTWKLERR